MLKFSKLYYNRCVILRFVKFHFHSMRSLSCNNICRNTTKENEDSYYFGHQQVSSSEKREKVHAVFSNVATNYDLMNDVMSLGIHRLWKDYFMHCVAPTQTMKVLDVAGGTGDIAFRFLKSTTEGSNSKFVAENKSDVTVMDFNEKMLSICKRKAEKIGVTDRLTCIQGNAEILPFPDNAFDLYTIAFGIRNVVHIEKALLEAFRVLRSGGRFLCLEFSEVKNPFFSQLYQWYSKEIIPVFGEVIASDWKSYQYLIESIQKFPNQDHFSCMIKESGFSLVTYENLSNGIAAIHSAYKL